MDKIPSHDAINFDRKGQTTLLEEEVKCGIKDLSSVKLKSYATDINISSTSPSNQQPRGVEANLQASLACDKERILHTLGDERQPELKCESIFAHDDTSKYDPNTKPRTVNLKNYDAEFAPADKADIAEEPRRNYLKTFYTTFVTSQSQLHEYRAVRRSSTAIENHKDCPELNCRQSDDMKAHPVICLQNVIKEESVELMITEECSPKMAAVKNERLGDSPFRLHNDEVFITECDLFIESTERAGYQNKQMNQQSCRSAAGTKRSLKPEVMTSPERTQGNTGNMQIRHLTSNVSDNPTISSGALFSRSGSYENHPFVHSVHPNNTRSSVSNSAPTRLNTGQHHKEAKIYLIRAGILFLTLIALSLIFLMMLKTQYFLRAIFITSYGYLLTSILYTSFAMRSRERESWRIIEDFFKILDYICTAIFTVFLDLKINKITSTSSSLYTSIPFFLLIIVYCWKSRAPKRVRITIMLMRVFYLIQSLLINAQINKIINMDWRIIFGPCWIYLAVIMLYCVSFSITLAVMGFYLLLREQMYREVEQTAQIYGALWYFLYYSLGVLAFIVLIEVCQILNFSMRNDLILQMSLYTALGVNTTLIVLIILGYKHLVKFVELFRIREDLDLESDRLRARQRDGSEVNLQIMKRESYFVRLSTTYFSPLNRDFYAHDGERRRKLKNIIFSSDTKRGSYRSEIEKEAPNKAPIDIEVLKQDKQTLDGKLLRSSLMMESTPSKKARVDRTKLMTEKPKGTELTKDEEECKQDHAKQHISADEFEIIKDFDIKLDKPSSSGKLCYICCSNPADAVLMKCRHGGVCYNCAVKLIKKDNKCMECRGIVEAIYKIDPNPKMSDIVKAVEVTKVFRNSSRVREEAE